MNDPAIHLIIHGRVQGVGYRAFAERSARMLGLTGWVRNRRDGTVELVARGNAAQLAALKIACARGPMAASVKQIDETVWEGELPEEFMRLPTA